jgi:hypothetical protein
MNKEQLIIKWNEKYSSLLSEYNERFSVTKEPNSEIFTMYRMQMKNVLDFIDDIKKLGLSDVSNPVCPIGKLNNETCYMRNNNGSCKGCPHLKGK